MSIKYLHLLGLWIGVALLGVVALFTLGIRSASARNLYQEGTLERPPEPVVAQTLPDQGSAAPAGVEDPVFSKVYAHVNTKDSKVPVYASPEEAISSTNPLRELNGYEWVTVIDSTEINGVALSQINASEWVYSDRLTFFRPSRFQGRTFNQTPNRPVAWVISEFQPTVEPEGDVNETATAYQRYDVVTIYEKALAGNTMWYRIGDDQWVRQQRLAVVSPRHAPSGMRSSDQLHGKWISVNLFEQTIAAYEGERMVYASLVSSGLPRWETVKGLFQIQFKNKSQPMYNAARDPGLGEYYLEEVPYNMFFDNDYALHGAYWHDGFGFKKSRGCVNLSVKDAKWFFNWSQPYPSEYGYAQASPDNPGTWVWVH
jgi:hypothetical protein